MPTVLVHTAYSNTITTQYLQRWKTNLVCVPTGVKYTKPVIKDYVISASVEPNGHGSIFVKWD